MRVVALVADLMDRSRLGAAASPSTEVVFVSAPDGLAQAAGGADLVVVDLTRPGALDALEALDGAGTRVVGFGPHVEGDLLDAARRAGCDEVLPRSRFFARLPELLGG